MKTNLVLGLAIFAMVSCGLAGADDKPATSGDADAAWKAVDEAMNALTQRPEKRPQTREEAMDYLKKRIQAFDEAFAKFLVIGSSDARRWKARLIEAQTAGLREQLDLPSKGGMISSLKEIVEAPDADAGSKGEASAILILESEEEAEVGGKIDDWIARAGAHLKAYPATRLNSAIESKIETQKTMADLRKKPIDIKFTATDGSEVSMEKLRGKVVLIDFWATWCGPCVAELPNVLRAYAALHDKGFEIVGISLDSDRAKLDRFVQEKGMKWPQYFDGKGWENEISSRFGIDSIPAMWLVDKKGMLVSTSVRGRLEEAVEKALAAE